MAENSDPKAAPGTGQTSSGDTQTAVANHGDAHPSGNELTRPHPAQTEPNAQQKGNSTLAADATATTTSDTRVYSIPTFSTATEKEIRIMMNSVRSIREGHTINEEDIMKLAALTANLVELMNAEYIAKDTIVRAVAYMRGESQPSARRALSQAQRDRRAARRNRNSATSGQRSQDKTQQDHKTEPHPTGTTPTNDDKSKDTKAGTTDPSLVSPEATALPSDTDHEGKVVGNATKLDKEDTMPTGEAQSINSGPHLAKGKKKRYWKPRRQNGKHAADENHAKNAAPAVVETGATGTTVKDGAVAAVEVGSESDSNNIDKAPGSESKGGSSDKEIGKGVTAHA